MTAAKLGTDILAILALPAPSSADRSAESATIAADFTALTGLAATWQILAPAAIAAAAEGRRAIIVYPGLARCLAMALETGDDPVAALQGWRQTAADLLALFRRRRSTTFLVDSTALAALSPGLADSLLAFAGIDAASDAPADDPADEMTDDPADDPLGGHGHNRPDAATEAQAAILATAAFLTARDLRDQAEELGATGFALPVPRPAPDAAAQMVALLQQGLRDDRQLAGLAAERNSLHAEVAARQDRIAALEAEIAGLRAGIATLEGDRDGLRAEIARQTAEAGRAGAEAKTRQDRIAALEAEIAGLRAGIATLEGDRDGLRAEIARQTAEAGRAGAEAKTRQDRIAALEAEIAGLRKALEAGAHLARQVAGLQDRLEQDHHARKELHATLTQREERIRQLDGDLRSRDERLRILDGELQGRKTEIARLGHDLRSREKQQAGFLIEAENDRLAEIAGLQRQIAADRAWFEAELAQVRASTSWRLTAPVRALRRGLDRLRPGRRGA